MLEDPCLELFPGSRRRHSGAFFLSLLSRALRAIPCTLQIFVDKICAIVECKLC